MSDSQGRTWRCHPDQLYVVEATIPSFTKELKKHPEYSIFGLLDMLPTVSCLTPYNALKIQHSGG